MAHLELRWSRRKLLFYIALAAIGLVAAVFLVLRLRETQPVMVLSRGGISDIRLEPANRATSAAARSFSSSPRESSSLS